MLGLDELLSYTVEEVLKSPQLRGAVVGYYSRLFNGGNPPGSCDHSITVFYHILKRDGIEKQQKILNMKYQLKPEIGFIIFDNQKYNSSEMTDEIAEAYLKKFPKAIGNFKVNENAPEKEPEKPKAKRGPKAEK